jgi:hypothetical protein
MIIPASTLTPTPGVTTTDPEIARQLELREAWRDAIDANRDRWDRPLIMLPDDSRETGYRRASSYGSPLEDKTALTDWKMRQVARGISRRRALALAVTRAETGLDGPYSVAKKAKTELNEICKKAMDVVESGDKALIGTSLHHICELIDFGQDPGHIPQEWRPDINAYLDLTRGFRMRSIELFIVQDDHQSAGTLDRAVEVIWPLVAPDGTIIPPGSIIIGDVKTAQDMSFAGGKFGVQCFIYATGIPYDPINKKRYDWGHEPPRTDWAVIFHVPSGQGTAKLYWVNLAEAEEAAEDVRRVYEWRNRRGKLMICQGRPGEDFTESAAAAKTVDELTVIYRRAVAVEAWTDELRLLFAARRVEIETLAVAG